MGHSSCAHARLEDIGFDFELTEEDVQILRSKGELAGEVDEFNDRMWLEVDDHATCHPDHEDRRISDLDSISLPAPRPKRSSQLALLLGWNYSTRAQMGKYAAVYGRCGFGKRLLFTPTLPDTYGVDRACRIAHKTVAALAALVDDEPKTRAVIHVFSGSVYIYIRMLVKHAVAGVVFDSTPIDASAANGTNAVMEVSSLPRLAWGPLYTVFWLYWNAVMPFNAWVGKWKSRFWTSIFPRPPLRAPVAFFYSPSDNIAPADFIEAQARALVTAGLRAELYPVPPTPDGTRVPPHCTHLMLHPDWYAGALETFLGSLDGLELDHFVRSRL
ncbi:uncharacterized protein AMSG_00887 [Thecamonas trahens ATCC 50062]|uniref:Transmembrane protein 53 n=1 Tax=Thecamonas trahens ATCC 50062 TaxID=461836 RepID=A0A0L0DIP6_THETB|nr:hypothetical protein AMSG_00887 [Thecamonas trahens ATCC 50062]KNC52060.1 hypothetical protein AMSG_00887 [Thecamonas trahens ATCC 50062]|eukprot:XP_013762066.1 hypothetical protein AMSG_00887 [Thecamonas trahens ATCC 50062]